MTKTSEEMHREIYDYVNDHITKALTKTFCGGTDKWESDVKLTLSAIEYVTSFKEIDNIRVTLKRGENPHIEYTYYPDAGVTDMDIEEDDD